MHFHQENAFIADAGYITLFLLLLKWARARSSRTRLREFQRILQQNPCSTLQTRGTINLNLPLIIGILTGTAAWMLVRSNQSATRNPVPADEAATRLRQAWADYHTTQ